MRRRVLETRRRCPERTVCTACIGLCVPMFWAFIGCESPGSQSASAPATQPVAARPITRTAKNGPLSVTVTTDRDRVAGGEPLKLTVHVEAEKGVAVQVPLIESVIGDFEVKHTTQTEPPCGEYTHCAEWEYDLVCVMPGVATIPSLPFAFEDPREKADGSTGVYRDQLLVESIEITVDASLADVKGAIRVTLPFESRLLWWIVGTVGFVALVALVARMVVKGGMPTVETRPMPPPEPAHLWALRELDRLEAERLVERGLVQDYYYRVNGLLRGYIERRFGLMAGEQTSEEFVRELQSAEILNDDQKSTLQRFVAACDPVKYAKQIPTLDETTWVGRCARDFVVQTVPIEQPASSSERSTMPIQSPSRHGGAA